MSFLSSFLPKITFYFLVLFFVLLPFHAFGVTTLSHFFLESGSPAPVILKMWKEILVVVIFVLIIGFVGASIHRAREDGGCDKSTPLRKNIFDIFKNIDILDWLIIGFSVLAIFISLLQKISGDFSFHSFIFGIKYTLFPLWIFVVFRRIPSEISQKFLRNFWKLFLYFSGGIIFSGLSFFVLAQYNPEFFGFLGYSTDHSFYSLFQPLSYCQKISFTEICRAQGVFSGPNQMGAYLIFLIMMLVGLVTQKGDHKGTPLLLLFGILLLVLTFSRSAWIGGFFAGLFFVFFLPEISRKIKIYIFSGILFFPFIGILLSSVFFPEISDKIINRVSSSSEHYELSVQGIEQIANNPLGSGLGTAGAASKYESEKGIKEVGFIPENWYLQIGIETGILGIFFWLGIVFLVMKRLVQKNHIKKNVGNSHGCSLHNQNNLFSLSLASALFGISIMGLFLHSWESSAVAYTVWGLSGVILKKN